MFFVLAPYLHYPVQAGRVSPANVVVSTCTEYLTIAYPSCRSAKTKPEWHGYYGMADLAGGGSPIWFLRTVAEEHTYASKLSERSTE